MKGAHVSSAFELLCAGVPTEPLEAGASRASCDERYLTTVPCRGSFAQGGVTMRDCSTNRAGFDRVLMAVAATFLAVSATSALAGPSDTPRASAAELAIDAAIPRPEPANVPPPSIGDFKIDSTASVPDATKALDKATAKPSEPAATAKATEPDTKPAEIVTAPAKTNDTATTPPPAATTTPATATAPAAEPAREPAKAASNVAPADQPVADRLREMLAAKSLRYFDRKNERAAVEKFYAAREYAPQWTQAGKLTDAGKGVIARLKGAAADGLDPAEYPTPDFAAAASPDQLAEAELKLTSSMLDYARQAQSGRMHWSQVSGRYPLSRAPDRSRRSAGQHLDRQGRFRGARQLQSDAQALQGSEGEARRVAWRGRRTGDPDSARSRTRVQGRHQEAGRGNAGRSARAATARQARHPRQRRRYEIRRPGRRCRAQIPG